VLGFLDSLGRNARLSSRLTPQSCALWFLSTWLTCQEGPSWTRELTAWPLVMQRARTPPHFQYDRRRKEEE